MTQADQTDPRELIAFRISNQDYCVDIAMVREIRGWTPSTPLPQSPDYVQGVINLRGTVLPIIDMSRRLGFETTTPTARHVIVVVRVGTRSIGLLVEAVSDILSISEEQIQPTPDVACDTVRAFVRGVIPIEGRMIGLIGLDYLLDEPEVEDAA